jgi:uncharacterized protein
VGVIETIGDGLWMAFQMLWEVGWALILGFLLSAIVQAWVPRSRMQRALGGRDLRSMALATGLGAASSSCSYAAIAIAKSMFQKGSSLATAMGFQFASTNLVFELGIVIWVFLGWQFALAEFIGGIVLIALMWLGLRLFVTRRLEEEAREHALAADTGHQHSPSAVEGIGLRERLTSIRAWSDVAYNFRGDVQMLWKEISAGFLVAGFVSLLPAGFFNALFITDAPDGIRIAENVVVGPLVAVLSFVCSVGNAPLAAVLWAGGISFSGVIAFIYADVIVIPIVLVYRKYYGWGLTWRLVGVMFVTMVAAALVVSAAFTAAGIVPETRPQIDEIAARGIHLNYTAFLNAVFLAVAAVLIGLTVLRGVRDPVCGMTVDRFATPHRLVYGGRSWFFCSAGCRERFEADPERYTVPEGRPAAAHSGGD